MQAQTWQVRQFSYNDNMRFARLAVSTITLAMSTDPTVQYFCRPNQAWLFLLAAMKQAMELYADEQQVYSTPEAECVAISYQYPRPPVDAWKQWWSGGWALLLAVRWGRLPLLLDAADYNDKQRERFYNLHGTYTYISVVATRPDVQGQGLGKRMIYHLLQQADSRQQWTYIEASSTRSKALYEKLDFQVLGSFQPLPNMPPTWAMCRPPAGSTVGRSSEAGSEAAGSGVCASADAAGADVSITS